MSSDSISSIAVLLTCHNRKDQTLDSIRSLYESVNSCPEHVEISVYLTDDGSSDGTGNAVKEMFPDANILQGTGDMYWNGGMRNSWKEALKKQYDAFLLLNDDTKTDLNCLDELLKTHEYSVTKYGKSGIYVGSTINPETKKFSYGGSLVTNRWSFNIEPVIPDGHIKECHLGNANIMLVTMDVVNTIGILSEKYIHGKADHDYTLRAIEKNIPVLVCADYCGLCRRNERGMMDFSGMNLKQRIQHLRSPKGVEISGYMYFMKRFFPMRVPIVFLSLWIKTLFPVLAKIFDRESIR